MSWTDQEIARYERRVLAIAGNGIALHEAERLAEQLLHRDRPEGDDDRRVCWECHFFKPPKRCNAGQPAMPLVLQRCPQFSAKGGRLSG